LGPDHRPAPLLPSLPRLRRALPDREGRGQLRIPDRSRRHLARMVTPSNPGTDIMDTLSPPPVDPRRYFEAAGTRPAGEALRPPVCLYLEVTNRCNLLCTTCPRTSAELEPPADM